MTRYYAGVGSRETPEKVLKVMTALARHFFIEHELTLRSGGAAGADTAFAEGASDWFLYRHEIILPQNNFNKHSDKKDAGYYSFLTSTSISEKNRRAALDIAEQIHPAWAACSTFASLAHARNVIQILGLDLKTPVEFVVGYAKEKTIDCGRSYTYEGGTRTAFVLAEQHNIPVVNLFRKSHLKKAELYLAGIETDLPFPQK